MNIKVTTTKVKIEDESLNKGEYNIRECNFDLAEEFTGLVCKALFTVGKTKLTYEQSIVNNKCSIPYEATEYRGKVEVGVIAYEVEDEELIKRYSPEPDEFFVLDGSYVEDIENQSTPTPSELEQLEQRVSIIEIDTEQVEINTQDISDIKQEQITQNNDILLRSLITETGSQIELSLNSTNFKMTAILKDKNGTVVNTSNEIDLPLESVVVNASYDSTTKELVLTLQNGTTVRVSIADLVSGLVSDTDYATTSKAGVVRAGYGLSVKSNTGETQADTFTYESYQSKSNGNFIGKGTLENVITGKQLVNETQLNTKADKSSLVTGTGENITLQNTAELEFIQPPLPRGNSEQDGEPSPTNEVPISNVIGDVEVKVQNKNLALNDDPKNPDANYVSSGGGSTIVQYSIEKDGYFTINHRKRSFGILKPGSYVFSITAKARSEGTSAYTILTSVKGYNESVISKSLLTNEYNRFTYAFTISEDKEFAVVFYDTLYWKDIQLEQNTTASTYTPHKEQTFLFPLGTQRMYLGDYLADDGIHHVRKQVNLSTLTWSSYGTNKYGSNSIANEMKKPTSSLVAPDFIFEKYIIKSASTTLTNGQVAVSTSGVIIIYDETGSPSGTIEYELSEEEITPYTTEQQTAYNEIKQALSYEEQTNISGSSDESNPLFEVQAVEYKEPDYWTIAYVNAQIGNAIGGAY